MQAILLLILAIGLAGCTSDDKFEQVGLYSNESYTKLKKDYIAATGYEANDDLVNRLGNMLALAENNEELIWSSSRLFETLAESNEYQSILAYTEQLKQRGLNKVMMANVLYTEANTYNVLSKNRWAEKFGVEQPYRNYENLRNAIKSYACFIWTYNGPLSCIQRSTIHMMQMIFIIFMVQSTNMYHNIIYYIKKCFI